MAEKREEREERIRRVVVGLGKGVREAVRRARRWARVGVVRWVRLDRRSERDGDGGGEWDGEGEGEGGAGGQDRSCRRRGPGSGCAASVLALVEPCHRTWLTNAWNRIKDRNTKTSSI